MNRYALYLIAAMLLVGSNVGVGKSIVAFIPVSLFALLRFVIAMAVLWPLLRPAKIRRVKRGEWVNLFLQALFGTFMFTLLMLNGVQRTSAVAAGVITSTIPAVVALFSWFFLKERPNGRALVSIALAIIGVVVINVAQELRTVRTVRAGASPIRSFARQPDGARRGLLRIVLRHPLATPHADTSRHRHLRVHAWLRPLADAAARASGARLLRLWQRQRRAPGASCSGTGSRRASSRSGSG